MIKVKGLKMFDSVRYGAVYEGREFSCDEDIARQWEAAGMVEPLEEYSTKVVQQTPVAGNAPSDNESDGQQQEETPPGAETTPAAKPAPKAKAKARRRRKTPAKPK